MRTCVHTHAGGRARVCETYSDILALLFNTYRRARGSVPINPVINATETEPLKEYQPYDMTGAQQHPAPVVSRENKQINITMSTRLYLSIYLIYLFICMLLGQ